MSNIILRLIFILMLPTYVNATSFDCNGKLNTTEKAICSHTALSLLDVELSRYYLLALKPLIKTDKVKMIDKQRRWLRERNNLCNNNVDCLLILYAERIQQLSFQPEHIEKTKGTFSYRPDRNSFDPEEKCDFSDVDFSSNLTVYAGGAYSGAATFYQIDQSGHETTEFNVVVNSPDSPVALVLSAYEPSVWYVKWTENTKVEAVYASGYHRQIVIGLPDNVPVITAEMGNKANCPSIYIESKTLNKLNPLSLRLFNKKVSLVTQAKRGKLGFGQAFDRKAQIFTNTSITINDYVHPIFSYSGKYGLDNLIDQGYLRKYNVHDVDRWNKLKSEKFMESLPPVSGFNISSKYKPDIYVGQRGYVILKKTRIPAGLYGADSVVFFLNENVPYPEGSLGHSKLYDFNTFKCKGTGCNR